MLEAWHRTGTTGAGVGMVERLSEEYVSFMANRITTNGSVHLQRNKTTAKRRREARGKTLNFRSSAPEVQKGLLESRAKEWKKWCEFNAAEPIMGKPLQELLDEGHKALPMQWIETDKNDHLRVPGGPAIEPLYKSRLVARGDLETADVRTDSPTCDLEAQNMIFSFAASMNLDICSADITNAYFQGNELDRLMLFKQPPGGLPGLPEEAHLVARVPIYGTRDAGRGFWKKLREVILKCGMTENQVLKATYSIEENGKILAILGTHVDDILWATVPEKQHVIDAILEKFKCGTQEKRNFRYCGKEVRQSDDFSIKVTCSDTTLKMTPIRIAPTRRNNEAINDSERTQLKSVAGSLQWIARQCRPDLCYRVSRLQSVAATATVRDLRDANKIVDYAKVTHSNGLTFKSGLLDWDTMVMCVITDASHGNELEYNEVKKL